MPSFLFQNPYTNSISIVGIRGLIIVQPFANKGPLPSLQLAIGGTGEDQGNIGIALRFFQNHFYDFKRNISLSSIIRQEKKSGGVSDSLLDVRKGGGGSFRCVLCATGGVGGSKYQEKMRM